MFAKRKQYLQRVTVQLLEQLFVACKHDLKRRIVTGEMPFHKRLEFFAPSIFCPPEISDLVQPALHPLALVFAVLQNEVGFKGGYRLGNPVSVACRRRHCPQAYRR